MHDSRGKTNLDVGRVRLAKEGRIALCDQLYQVFGIGHGLHLTKTMGISEIAMRSTQTAMENIKVQICVQVILVAKAGHAIVQVNDSGLALSVELEELVVFQTKILDTDVDAT